MGRKGRSFHFDPCGKLLPGTPLSKNHLRIITTDHVHYSEFSEFSASLVFTKSFFLFFGNFLFLSLNWEKLKSIDAYHENSNCKQSGENDEGDYPIRIHDSNSIPIQIANCRL
jgi:hypothetical protein